MRRVIVGVTAVVAMAACGGSSAPATSINGSIHGQSVQGRSATSSAVTINTNGKSTNFAAILISTDDNLCSELSSGRQPKNLQATGLWLFDSNTSSGSLSLSAPVAAGDYQVFIGSGTPPSKGAMIGYSQTDASCNRQPALGAIASSGVVHLTGVNNGVYSGSFDITVAETDSTGAATSTTDHWTGSFQPSPCPGLNAAFFNQTPLTCF